MKFPTLALILQFSCLIWNYRTEHPRFRHQQANVSERMSQEILLSPEMDRYPVEQLLGPEQMAQWVVI